MGIRNRLTLVLLLVALMPVAIFSLQANSAFRSQQRSLQNELNALLAETPELNQPALENRINILRQESQRIATSLQYNNLVLAASLGMIILILAVVLSRMLTLPLDLLVERARSAYLSIQGMLSDVHAMDKKGDLNLVTDVLNLVETRLAGHVSLLEKQLGLRAEEIRQRNEMLTEIGQIFSRISEIQSLDQLLQEAAQQIATRFTLYHAAIYLVDASGEYAVLRAADRGAGGQRMVQAGLRLRVGREGIVGNAAAVGKIVYVPDIQLDPHYIPNIHLPAARSELVLPLLVKGRVIGVLDVQSTFTDGFDQEKRELLNLVARYLSLVIENIRLFEQAHEALEAERRAYSEITRSGWEAVVRSRRQPGYRANEQGVFHAEEELQPWMREALERGEVVYAKFPDHTNVSVPIRVREDLLGVIDFRKNGENVEFSEEERALVQTLTDQLGQALDSARLYQNAQFRAERERILSDITAKVRSSTNINTILQTAIKELAEVLRVPKGVIRLGAGDGGEAEDEPSHA